MKTTSPLGLGGSARRPWYQDLVALLDRTKFLLGYTNDAKFVLSPVCSSEIVRTLQLSSVEEVWEACTNMC